MTRPTVLVTGATGGLGRALCAAFAADHRVLACGRSPERLRALAADLPDAAAVVADLADPAAAAAAVREATAGLAGLDVLVHNAGVALLGPVADAEADVAGWTSSLAVNVTAVATVTAALVPLLRAARGHVVVINSGQGLAARGTWAPYAAAKHAQRALADALRQEEAAAGVRVTSVYPGRIATPMQEQVARHEGHDYDPDAHLSPVSVARAVRAAVDGPSDAVLTDLTVRPAPR